MPDTADHQRSDEELAAGAASGDREAFAVLYERYFRRIFDFTRRTLRDHHLAGDVVQTTFVKAWEKLRSQQPVRHVKAWLFTIARNAAIDELRRRRRLVSAPSEEDTPLLTEIDLDRWADPELVLRDRELVEMVWSAAQALSRDEYTLLDLHLRQELSADELAAALQLRKGAVYTRLSRLRGALEAAVTVQVLARRGREDCPELAALLHEAETADLTPELRRTVERHVADCPICEERKRRLLAPAEIFAGLAPIAVDGELRKSIWRDVVEEIDSGAARRRPGRRPWALTGSILVALLAAAAVVFAMWARRAPLAEDPGDVHSPSHQVGVAATAAVVTVRWTPPSTATGYSVTWSERPVDLPDEVVDLAGDAAGTESPPLLPGDWYFHLRTRGRGGDWTATVHLGPFLIRGPQETGAPAPSTSTTSSSTAPASTTTATTTTTTTTTTTPPPSTTPPTTSPPPTRPR